METDCSDVTTSQGCWQPSVPGRTNGQISTGPLDRVWLFDSDFQLLAFRSVKEEISGLWFFSSLGLRPHHCSLCLHLHIASLLSPCEYSLCLSFIRTLVIACGACSDNLPSPGP